MGKNAKLVCGLYAYASMAMGDPLNLDEVVEWDGLWWLPDARGEQIPRYEPDNGLVLAD